jgi:hypothetical protein
MERGVPMSAKRVREEGDASEEDVELMGDSVPAPMAATMDPSSPAPRTLAFESPAPRTLAFESPDRGRFESPAPRTLAFESPDRGRFESPDSFSKRRRPDSPEALETDDASVAPPVIERRRLA